MINYYTQELCHFSSRQYLMSLSNIKRKHFVILKMYFQKKNLPQLIHIAHAKYVPSHPQLYAITGSTYSKLQS